MFLHARIAMCKWKSKLDVEDLKGFALRSAAQQCALGQKALFLPMSCEQ
jgi:hypothetical protein